jgi:hypothetical protein
MERLFCPNFHAATWRLFLKKVGFRYANSFTSILFE